MKFAFLMFVTAGFVLLTPVAVVQTITNKLNKNAGVEMLYMLDLVFEVGFGDAPEVYGDMFVGFEVAVNK